MLSRKHGENLCTALAAWIVLVGTLPAAQAIEPLKLAGRHFVDSSGQRVVLRGCNLGNWLLLEPWMLDVDPAQFRDQFDIVQTLEKRFGKDGAEALLDRYRANWITPREFEIVKSFGFNLVRVPFYHGLLANEDNPYQLRPDAFEWLDRAVEWADQFGIYVILDMHGAPGGQSVDMPSGRVGENRLWTETECQKRMAWMWQRIAERYHDRPAVIAYDIVNEPFGDFNTDIRASLLGLSGRVHDAIRAVDPVTLILIPGTTHAIGSYQSPKAYGWSHVGYTEHFYPGLFGNGSSSLATHGTYLSRVFPARAKFVEQLDVPYLVGEFNVVFDTCDQPGMMRRYFDDFAKNGWMATMWSLRIMNAQGGVHANNWYLATNAAPFKLPDFQTASRDEIAAAFDKLGTMKLAIDDELRQALTAPQANPRFALPEAAAPISAKAPLHARPLDAKWKRADVAAYPAGGAWRADDGGVVVVGGGNDIWAAHDAFHFAYRPISGDALERSWLTDFDAAATYAKAGWMIRADLAPDAPHALVHAFPNGMIRMAWRAKRGGPTQEATLTVGGWPLGVGIERRGNQIIAHYTDADRHWHEQAFEPSIAVGDKPLIGMVVLSHDDVMLASARFLPADKSINSPAHAPSANLLRNASFETKTTQREDRAADWQAWGQWLNRESGWSPKRDGQCVLGYHHYRIEQPESSGWYQDVTGLSPGETYTFAVWANRDKPAEGKFGPDSIELRVEYVEGDRVWQLASRTYKVNDLASGDAWSRLSVKATIPRGRARLLLVVNPSNRTPRDAALKFDDASLRVADNGALYAQRSRHNSN
jgi:endoglucanase